MASGHALKMIHEESVDDGPADSPDDGDSLSGNLFRDLDAKA